MIAKPRGAGAICDTAAMTLTRRRLLASAWGLGAPLFVRHAGAEAPRFALGVASGHPRPDRLVLWTRLTGLDLPAEVEVQWELADDEGFTRSVARGSETAQLAWAHSVHAEPAGLAPGRWYWYRFTALGQRSPVGRTRTAPAADARTALTFAIASCQRWDHGHYAAWQHLAAQPPDLMMFLGDYIYEYPSPPDALRTHDGPLLRTLDQYRRRYAQYKSDPALQAAHAACPWLVVQDDHEVENDCAGDRGTTVSGPAYIALRAAAYQAWWEHQPCPKAMRPVLAQMRMHGRVDWGRLARIHTLDTRQYRDAQVCPPWLRVRGSSVVSAAECPDLLDPRRTLLGAHQERWLAEGWDLERPWNLLAQQTLMARLSRRSVETPGGGTYSADGWDGYAPARQRLLDAVAQRRVPNLVVLGGDLHAHLVSDLKLDFDDPKSPVIASEFCGSSISSHGPRQAELARRLAFNAHLHHGRGDQRGYVAFTLDERRLEARLMAVERPDDPRSPVAVDARYAVEAGRPGPQRA